jgi:hypothetical protein
MRQPFFLAFVFLFFCSRRTQGDGISALLFTSNPFACVERLQKKGERSGEVNGSWEIASSVAVARRATGFPPSCSPQTRSPSSNGYSGR